MLFRSKERAGYIIFILTTVALIFQRQLRIETWVICLTGAVAMVLFGVLTEKEAVASINWPMAFLLVGSFAMGGALTETGAGEVVGNVLAIMANSIDNPFCASSPRRRTAPCATWARRSDVSTPGENENSTGQSGKDPWRPVFSRFSTRCTDFV